MNVSKAHYIAAITVLITFPTALFAGDIALPSAAADGGVIDDRGYGASPPDSTTSTGTATSLDEGDASNATPLAAATPPREYAGPSPAPGVALMVVGGVVGLTGAFYRGDHVRRNPNGNNPYLITEKSGFQAGNAVLLMTGAVMFALGAVSVSHANKARKQWELEVDAANSTVGLSTRF